MVKENTVSSNKGRQMDIVSVTHVLLNQYCFKCFVVKPCINALIPHINVKLMQSVEIHEFITGHFDHLHR